MYAILNKSDLEPLNMELALQNLNLKISFDIESSDIFMLLHLLTLY